MAQNDDAPQSAGRPMNDGLTTDPAYSVGDSETTAPHSNTQAIPGKDEDTISGDKLGWPPSNGIDNLRAHADLPPCAIPPGRYRGRGGISWIKP